MSMYFVTFSSNSSALRSCHDTKDPPRERYSEMESEKTCDHNDHHDLVLVGTQWKGLP
jgi:hypothetical protein